MSGSRENFNDLHVFVQVVQEGSFTRAAVRLGVAQSGVSRTVRDLERRLGVRLLVRTTRRLALTQAGERLYDAARHGFGQLEAGLKRMAHYRDIPSGTVRINASHHAIDKLLLPRLASFREQYPDIRLELISENRFVDIVAERFDAGVRLGGEVGDNMIAVRIGLPLEMVVVGAPGHFRHHGFPRCPQDLASHPCIAAQFANGSLYAWELVQEGALVHHMPRGQWVFSESYMEAAAARAGLGLAYVPLDLVAEDIEHGRLIRVLKPFSHHLGAWYLYYPHRNITPALRMVVEHLRV